MHYRLARAKYQEPAGRVHTHTGKECTHIYWKHLCWTRSTLAGAVQVELVDYGMNSVSQGIDAMAITRVVIRPVMSCSGVTPQVCTLPTLVRWHAVSSQPQLPCVWLCCHMHGRSVAARFVQIGWDWAVS